MIKNFFNVALRNLRKQGFYSLINIAGLAVGVAACLVIVLFINDELNYDRFNANGDRIYRLNEEIKFGGNHIHMTYTAAPVPHTMMLEYPEIEATVRFRSQGSYLVKTAEGADNIKEPRVIWTDSTFFRIFSVKVLEGNPDKALSDPASVAISESTAKKYFPGRSALGQSLILDNKYHATVTAVYEDIPAASHFHFDILVAMVGDWPVAKEAQSNAYLSENFQSYFLLKKGTDAKALEKKLPGFLVKYVGPQIAQVIGNEFSMEKFVSSGNKFEYSFTPLFDIHLHSDLKGEFEPNGSITYVYLLATIALFILVIASVNFMNLSTARSAGRAREVGVRKVMGSQRGTLIGQFLVESVMVTLIALAMAVLIAWLFLPMFNSLSLKQLQLPFHSPYFYFIAVALSILIGVMAGVYPAFFLSSFNPVNVLKGRSSRQAGGAFIRSSLVVFQFVISIFLIVGAITVNRQLQYIQSKKLGFDKSQVLLIHDAYALRPYSNVVAFKNESLKIAGVQSGTISGFLPIEGPDAYRNNSAYWVEGKQPTTDNLVSMQRWAVDMDYIKTLGIQITDGRAFSPEHPSDSSGIILNKAALKLFGFENDPLGKKIVTFEGMRKDGSPDPAQTRSMEVIGVMDDFHFSSMKEAITPLGLILDKQDGAVAFKINGSNIQELITSIEKIWKTIAPGQPFMYSFLDEDFNKMYANEQRLGRIFTVFAGLAIIIACLGLFALTAYTAERRTKEIGIRKVMGASEGTIVVLLSKEFSRLILIAFAISLPLSWYAAGWWLESYTYKTEIGPLVFLLAGGMAFMIAWLTMGYQSIKAAIANPVKALRTE
ncbi:MAG: ABC transporter permease [Bacteroidetes bacterium]|nr:ABC transporter permease [Bacteroidota bacterium]